MRALTGRTQAREARSSVTLPAGSVARTRSQYVPGPSFSPSTVGIVQSTPTGPAGAAGSPCSPTGLSSTSTTAHSTVTPSSAGAVNDSLTAPVAVGAVGRDLDGGDLGRRGVDADLDARRVAAVQRLGLDGVHAVVAVVGGAAHVGALALLPVPAVDAVARLRRLALRVAEAEVRRTGVPQVLGADDGQRAVRAGGRGAGLAAGAGLAGGCRAGGGREVQAPGPDAGDGDRGDRQDDDDAARRRAAGAGAGGGPPAGTGSTSAAAGVLTPARAAGRPRRS